MTPWLCWQVLTGILFSSLRLLFEGEEGGLIMLGNRHDFRWEDVLKPGYCRKHPLNISCFDLDSFLWLSLLLFCLSSFLPLFFSFFPPLLLCLLFFVDSSSFLSLFFSSFWMFQWYCRLVLVLLCMSFFHALPRPWLSMSQKQRHCHLLKQWNHGTWLTKE